jgi:putative OmpL-like beta-barrel porin-2
MSWNCERGREGEENHMNCTTRCIPKWAIAAFALAVAIAVSPTSRAEDQPSSPAASQPAATSQPAAAAQPTADQRLEELEKEVMLLQQEIAALKNEGTPEMKSAAYAIPGTAAAAGSLAPASPAEDAPKINLAGLLGPVTLSGFGDVYYSYDNNHPFNNMAGLRFFEAPTNGFNFNMAEVILDKAPDATSADSRIGYHVSAGYGQAAKIVNGSDNTGFGDGSNFFVKEAYASYLAPVGKGLTITVGKFVTNAGAEVIESNANWNYSRSLLFYYAIPFFHFGAKAAYTFNPKWSVNASLVNGWNNTIINHDSGVFAASSGLTYGATVAYTPSPKWSATENYYVGPVTGGFKDSGATDNFWRHLSDTVIGYTPNAKWAFQVNGDYGFVQDTSPVNIKWWGVAGYAKYTLSPKTNFAVRYEYYEDPNAFTGLLPDPDGDGTFKTGHAQEVTGTYSYNLTSALLIRGEYRYDFASQPIFVQSLSSPGNDTCFAGEATIKCVKEQNTATISFVYTFSSANAK